jgi:hypothetical protein
MWSAGTERVVPPTDSPQYECQELFDLLGRRDQVTVGL